MPEFFCTGSLELDNVVFFIQAESIGEAQEKARQGKWDEWDIGGAESINWELSPHKMELNE